MSRFVDHVMYHPVKGDRDQAILRTKKAISKSHSLVMSEVYRLFYRVPRKFFFLGVVPYFHLVLKTERISISKKSHKVIVKLTGFR